MLGIAVARRLKVCLRALGLVVWWLMMSKVVRWGGVDGEGKDKARAMRRVVARSKLGILTAIGHWSWCMVMMVCGTWWHGVLRWRWFACGVRAGIWCWSFKGWRRCCLVFFCFGGDDIAGDVFAGDVLVLMVVMVVMVLWCHQVG